MMKKIKVGILIIVISSIIWPITMALTYNGIGLSKLEKSTHRTKTFEGIIVNMQPKTLLSTSANKENRIGSNFFGTEITLFDGKKVFVSSGMIAYKIEHGQSKLTAYSYAILEQPNKRVPAKRYEEFVIHVSHREEARMKIDVFLAGGGITLGYLN